MFIEFSIEMFFSLKEDARSKKLSSPSTKIPFKDFQTMKEDVGQNFHEALSECQRSFTDGWEGRKKLSHLNIFPRLKA